MAPRYPSLRLPPLVLVSIGTGGASIPDIVNVLSPALAPGSFGFEGTAWLTADGHAVVHHDGVVRRGLRRRPLAELRLGEVADAVVALDRLLEADTGGAHVVVSVSDDATAAALAAAAGAAGGRAAGRVWLRADLPRARAWRALSADVGLVDSTRLRRLDHGPEHRAAALASAGIEAVQLPQGDWSPGLTTLFHRFGRLAFAGPAVHRRQLDAVLAMGVDAVSSDHADRLVEARAVLAGRPTGGPDRSGATP